LAAVAKAAPPAPAVATPRPQSEVLDGYWRGLGELLARHQECPRVAAMRGWEGEVRLRLKVGRKGNLIDVALDRRDAVVVKVLKRRTWDGGACAPRKTKPASKPSLRVLRRWQGGFRHGPVVHCRRHRHHRSPICHTAAPIAARQNSGNCWRISTNMPAWWRRKWKAATAEGNIVFVCLRFGGCKTGKPLQLVEPSIVRDGKIVEINLFYFDAGSMTEVGLKVRA
jgi:hypothetical protein